MPIPVIFQLSSEIGPGGFASLESAINMTSRLAKTVIAAVEELDKFSEMYQRVEIDMSSAMSAAKGLIGSMEMMASANKLTLAGIKPTAEQFAAISKGAVEMGDALGISSSEAMDKLTDAVVRASARGLKPLGIDLKTTGDLATDQIAALTALIEKFKETDAQVDTLSDSFGALIENSKTYISLLWTNSDATSKAAGEMSTLNEFTLELAVNQQRLADGVQSVSDTWTLELYNMARAVGRIGDPTSPFGKMAEFFDTLIVKGRQAAAALKGVVPELEAEQEPGMGRYRGASYATGEPLAAPAISKMPYTTIEGAKKERTGRTRTVTGAAGPTPAELLAQSVDERIQNEITLEENKKQLEMEELERKEELASMQLQLLETKQADHELVLLQMETLNNIKIAKMEELGIDEQKIALQRQIFDAQEEQYAAEFSYIEQGRKRWNASLENKLEMTAFFFNRVGLMRSAESKATFKLWKAVSIAEAVISGIVAARETYKSLSGIPIFGPALGALAAAGVGVATAASVRKIAATEYEGGGSVSFSQEGSQTTMQSGGQGYSNVQPINQQKEQQTVVYVSIGDQPVYDAVTRANESRSQNGQRSFSVR